MNKRKQCEVGENTGPDLFSVMKKGSDWEKRERLKKMRKENVHIPCPWTEQDEEEQCRSGSIFIKLQYIPWISICSTKGGAELPLTEHERKTGFDDVDRFMIADLLQDSIRVESSDASMMAMILGRKWKLSPRTHAYIRKIKEELEGVFQKDKRPPARVIAVPCE